MMRIDAHQHFWVYDQREYAWIDDSMASLRRDFLPNDLKPELERNGFQGSVVVQARRRWKRLDGFSNWPRTLRSFLVWSDGLICGPPTSVRNWKLLQETPSWLGFATSRRANQTRTKRSIPAATGIPPGHFLAWRV